MAAAGHTTEAKEALVRGFKADLKFAESFGHLKVLHDMQCGMHVRPPRHHTTYMAEEQAGLVTAASACTWQGFLTSGPGLVLQLNTALKSSNPVGDSMLSSQLTDAATRPDGQHAICRLQHERSVVTSSAIHGCVHTMQTVNITAVRLAYMPSAAYGGERRRRLLRASHRALQGRVVAEPGDDDGTPAGVLQFLSPHTHLHAARVKTTPSRFYCYGAGQSGGVTPQGAGVSVAASIIDVIKKWTWDVDVKKIAAGMHVPVPGTPVRRLLQANSRPLNITAFVQQTTMHCDCAFAPQLHPVVGGRSWEEDLVSAGDAPAADESGGLAVHKTGIAVAVSLIGQIRDMMQAIMDSQKTMANYAAAEQILNPGLQGRHLLQAKGRLPNRCSIIM